MFPNKQQAKHWIESTVYAVTQVNFECFKKLKFCPRTLQEGLYLIPNRAFAWMPTFQILANEISLETKSAGNHKTSYSDCTKELHLKILGELCIRIA